MNGREEFFVLKGRERVRVCLYFVVGSRSEWEEEETMMIIVIIMTMKP